MLNRNRKHLLKFANQIIQKIIYSKNKYNIKIKESYVEAGSGSLPNHKIESIAIMIKSKQYNAQKIADKFRAYRVPLIGYINNNIFHIDLKSIPEDQYFTLIKCLNVTLKS